MPTPAQVEAIAPDLEALYVDLHRNPELAFQVSQLPCDGVGLARMEFVINEHIKVHPMAVLHPERITDEKERAQVLALIAGHRDGASYFIERLAEGIGTIAAGVAIWAFGWRWADPAASVLIALLVRARLVDPSGVLRPGLLRGKRDGQPPAPRPRPRRGR